MKLKDADVQPNRIRQHEHLSPDLEVRAQAIYDILGKHLNQDRLRWADGFCFDLHPERELAIWENYAAAYKKFTDGKPQYHQAVAWRTILEHIANTEVEVVNLASPKQV